MPGICESSPVDRPCSTWCTSASAPMATPLRWCPGDPVLDVDDADVALSGLYQGRRRMTLTYPILNRARRILWVVTGAEKAGMVNRLLDGDRRFRPDAFAVTGRCSWPILRRPARPRGQTGGVVCV